nr:hypothetical protein Iba_chr14bCG16320 [Ipomoea batatas]
MADRRSRAYSLSNRTVHYASLFGSRSSLAWQHHPSTDAKCKNHSIRYLELNPHFKAPFSNFPVALYEVIVARSLALQDYQTTPLIPLKFGIMHSTQFDFRKHFPSNHLTSYITEQWSATVLCDKPLRYAHPDQLFDMNALCFGEHCTILLSSTQGFPQLPSNSLDYHPLWTSTQPLQELQQWLHLNTMRRSRKKRAASNTFITASDNNCRFFMDRNVDLTQQLLIPHIIKEYNIPLSIQVIANMVLKRIFICFLQFRRDLTSQKLKGGVLSSTSLESNMNSSTKSSTSSVPSSDFLHLSFDFPLEYYFLESLLLQLSNYEINNSTSHNYGKTQIVSTDRSDQSKDRFA